MSNYLEIYLEGSNRPLCKFEKFESGKAFDWVTSKGYHIIRKEVIPYTYWIVRELPKNS